MNCQMDAKNANVTAPDRALAIYAFTFSDMFSNPKIKTINMVGMNMIRANIPEKSFQKNPTSVCFRIKPDVKPIRSNKMAPKIAAFKTARIFFPGV